MENNKLSSESLATIIVSFRAFGCFKNEAKKAMIELMKRREDGNDFNFESYISSKINELPKAEINKDLMKILSSFGVNNGF